MKDVLVIAPHPDDETLGCGGTLLRHHSQGDRIHWLIVTCMSKETGYGLADIERRKLEIDQVSSCYQFHSVHTLNYPTTRLDTLPVGHLISAMEKVFKTVNPSVLYIPYEGDVHSDHRVVFEASAALTKWFRGSSLTRILSYEIPSETDMSLSQRSSPFQPNVFVNISDFLSQKMEILKIYSSELGEFPFPRSIEAVEALSKVRGTTAGFHAAEAFMLLKERIFSDSL